MVRVHLISTRTFPHTDGDDKCDCAAAISGVDGGGLDTEDVQPLAKVQLLKVFLEFYVCNYVYIVNEYACMYTRTHARTHTMTEIISDADNIQKFIKN